MHRALMILYLNTSNDSQPKNILIKYATDKEYFLKLLSMYQLDEENIPVKTTVVNFSKTWKQIELLPTSPKRIK